MAPTYTLPTAEALGLHALSPHQLYFCRCPTLCSAWLTHPLGNPLNALIYDNHRIREILRLQPRFKHGFHPRTIHAGMTPPWRVLQEALPHRQGHFLVAVGPQACDLGPQCYLSWEEARMGSKDARYGRGRCSRHRGADGSCLNARAAARPFALLFEWTPEQPDVNWANAYRWLTAPQLRVAAEAVREPSQSATPPTTPPRQPSEEPGTEAGTPPPPQNAPAEDLFSFDPDFDPTVQPQPDAAADGAARPPAKRRRLSDHRQRALDAFRAQLEAEQDAEEEERERVERERQEALERQRAEDREWLNTQGLTLEECCKQPDPSAARVMWEDWVLKQAAEIAERREVDARVRDRSQGMGPMVVEEHEVKAVVSLAVQA